MLLRRTTSTGRAIDVELAELELPILHPQTGITVGLPGGDVYLKRDVELGLRAERALVDLARVRAITLGLFIRNHDAARLGLVAELADVPAAIDALRAERARGAGLEVLGPRGRDTLIENARAALRRLKGPS